VNIPVRKSRHGVCIVLSFLMVFIFLRFSNRDLLAPFGCEFARRLPGETARAFHGRDGQLLGSAIICISCKRFIIPAAFSVL